MKSSKISLTPLGVIEGTSTKSGKSFKFWRYLMPNGQIASCSTELKAGDQVVLTQSGDYYNLSVATGAAFEVTLNAVE